MYLSNFKYPVEQTDPPRPPRETLPTMYDLPSEDPEEPGLPDEYHDIQPQLLSATFRLQDYLSDQIFTASDLNIYYDVRQPLRYKRPDWFAVVGVPRLYEQRDLRMSYVVWQEGVNPFVVVELLSPGTEDEDLGLTKRESDAPPTKWEVYEQILRIPYYVVFDRYTNHLRVYSLVGAAYEEIPCQESKVWLPSLKLGLGLWQGVYQGVERQWLRWYNGEGNWVLTEAEAEQQEKRLAQQQTQQAQAQLEAERQRAEAERQRAEAERQRAEAAEARASALEQRLRELGIDSD